MNLNGTISLLIACVEIALLLNVLFRAERNRINIKAIILIALLTGYQTIEFLICGAGLSYSWMAYLAFVVISFLPPLNLLFILSFLGYRNKKLVWLFLPALAFVIYYTFVINEFAVVSCTVLYASYNYPLGNIYGFFYYTPIVVALYFLTTSSKNLNERDKKLGRILITGMVIISFPVIITFALYFGNYQAQLSVIESIMCKFALAYALSLTYFTLNYKTKMNSE